MMVGIHPVGIVSVLANPTGEVVVHGDVSFVRDGNTLTITQGSHHAIINWDDFSIGGGSLTQFLQNASDSAVLNRVVTLNPSLIEGALQANGRVILINPNGITVGPNGIIDTNSFIGSTLDVSNDQFLNGGALDFVGDSTAAITNLGSVTGNQGVFLFARQIDNAGAIVAPGGQVGLATGSHILLQPAGGDSRVSVLVGTSTGATVDGDAIRNTGEVHAALVTLNATGSAYATAVNNEGIIRAQGFDTTGGRVVLTGGSTGTVYSSGTISAQNANGTGGHVEITGDRVALVGNALVDVSGQNGGGTALIGGGFQGSNASVQNASRTHVGKDARIVADAITQGDGGTVIVWADGDTAFHGNISARGGALGGNGGFAEVSGKEHLVYRGLADLRAANGVTGTLLLDPTDITIQIAGSTDLDLTGGVFSDESDLQATSILTVADLEAQLGLSNVEVTTDSTLVGPLGNITVANAVTWTNANTLTLTADNQISINAAVTNSATGGLTLNAGGGVAFGATVNLASGNLDITAGGNITQSAALTIGGTTTLALTNANSDILLGNQANNFGSSVIIGGTAANVRDFALRNTNAAATVTDLSSATNLRNVTLTHDNADVIIASAINATGSVRLQSDTGISQTAAGIITAAGLATGGNGAVTLSEANTFTAFASSSAANVEVVSTGAVNIGTVGGISGVSMGANALTLTADTLTQSQNIQVGALSLTTTAGDITLTAANNAITGALTVATPATQAVSIANNAATNLGAITLNGGSFTLVSTGAITQSGALDLATTATTLRTINNAGAAITLGDVTNAFGSLTAETRNAANTVNANADIALASANGFLFEGVRTLGNVSLVSGNLVTQTATSELIIGGTLSIDTSAYAGAGDVTLRNDAAATQFVGTTTVQGNVTIENTAAAANITQAGGSSVRVAGTLTANPGVGGSVTLTEGGNVITTLSSGDGSVIIRNVGDIDLDGSLITGPISGNLSVTALDQGLAFDNAADTGTNAVLLNVGGSNNQIGSVTFVTDNGGLSLANAGTNNITQSVDLVVAGTSSFISGGVTPGDITLERVGNNFTGAVSASGNNITLVDSNGIILGQTTAAGDYSVTAINGAITQQVATILDITGTSEFVASGANVITLSNANLLDGPVSVTHTGAGNVTLNNAQATVLGAIATAGGDLTITSNGALTQDAVDAINQTVGGQLILNVTGDITLDNVGNQLITVGNVASTGDVHLADSDGFALAGAVTTGAAGSLTLETTAGGVNQTGGAITAGELLLLGVGNYTLTETANNVGTLAANVTGDITLADANGLVIGSVNGTDGVATNGGALAITVAAGNLTIGQTVAPGVGNVSLQATTGQIVQGASGNLAMNGSVLSLNNGAGGAVGTSGTPILTSGSYSLNAAPTSAGGVFVRNQTVAGDIVLANVSPANGAVSIVNQVGSITVTGALASGVLGTVTLDADDDLIVNAAIDGSAIALVSGDELTLGANVGSGSTLTVTLDNDGTLTRTAGTVTAATSLTLLGAGDVGDGTVVNTLVTDTPLLVLNKPASGDVFVRDTAGNLTLQGLVNGTLVARAANDLFVPVGQTLTNNSATGLTALAAGGSINNPANSGNIALNGGGLWLNAGTSIGTSAVDLMDFSNAGTVTARAAGPIFLNNTAGDLIIGQLDASPYVGVNPIFANQQGIVTTVAGQGIRLNSAAGTTVTVNSGVQTTGGDIALVVASPGGLPNGLIVDALVQSGAGGGNYVIGGGTLINTNPIAGVGTTITLDGGGQDIIIATDQVYVGSVTFASPGDILIQASIAATGANANLTLTADNDLDGEGGVRIYDNGLIGSVSATGLITITGSDLIQSGVGDFDAIVLDAGSTRVSSSSNTQAIILQTTASGADARDIIIAGNVLASGGGTTLIQSLGSAASNIELTGAINASQTAATNTITLVTPGTLQLDGTITTASTNNNAITINNAGAITISSTGLLAATNSGGLSLLGAGRVGTGVGDDVLRTQDIGRFTFNKALADAFINQQSGDVQLQGTIGGLVLTVPAGGISNSAALTAGRVTLDAGADINLSSSNSIARFVNAPGATGMGFNVANNAVTTIGNFNYTAVVGAHLTLGELIATGPFGTSGILQVAGSTTLNLGSGGTNLVQLADSDIHGSSISITLGGSGAFASHVGDSNTTTILLNNAGAVTRTGLDNEFTASTSLTLQGVGSVGTLADALLINTSRLILNKVSAVPGTGDVFVNQVALAGGLQLDGSSGASVTVNLLGTGQDITQVAALNIGPGGAGGGLSAGPDVANNTDATLTLSTTGGSILLNNANNRVRNFGTIDVVDGAFVYVGANSASSVETRFTDDVNITGSGAAFTVTYGGNIANRRDLVIENGVEINVAGNVQIIRNTAGGANGSVYLGGNITTTENGNILFQTGTLADPNFTPVILTADVVLSTNSDTAGLGNVIFDGTVSNLTGAAPFHDLTIHAGEGDVTFQRLVGGAAGALRIGDLTINSQGVTTFNNQVFAQTVTTDAGGSTLLVFPAASGFAVDTTGNQTYGDAVRLAADIDLRSDADVIFNGTVDSSTALGARNLYVEAAGNTAFNGDVGVENFLETLTTDAPGLVTINGNDLADGITIRTRGTQTYDATGGIVVGGGSNTPNRLVTDVSDSTADNVAGHILLNGGLDGLNAGVNDLLLIAGPSGGTAANTGNIEFNGLGGATTELGDIVIRYANDVTTGGTVASTTFLQEASTATGTTTIGGAITTSSDQTPGYAQAPILAGGGIQIHANAIVVNDDLQANGNGRILLNSGTDLVIVGTTVETTGLVTADPAVNNRIDLLAADDLLIGDVAAGTATVIQTLNGAITLTANNANTGDEQGIVIQGSDANANASVTIAAQGTSGTLDITANANNGTVQLLGGDADGAFVDVSSTQAQTVTVAGAVGNALVIQGGNGDGAYAELSSAGTQQITVNVGNLLIQGGEGEDAYAAISGTGTAQDIQVLNGALSILADQGAADNDGGYAAINLNSATGNQSVSVTNGGILIQGGADEGEYATIEHLNTTGTQTVSLLTAGNLVIEGGDGQFAFADIYTEGAAQTIVVQAGDIALTGGAGEDAYAAITADQGTQLIAGDLLGTVGIGGNLSLHGSTTGGVDAYATIEADEAQRILVDGDLTLLGGTVEGAYASIESADTQEIDVTGSMLLTGGDADLTAAVVVADDAQDIIVGNGLTLTGGSLPGEENYAMILGYAQQDVTVLSGNLVLDGAQGSAPLAPPSVPSFGAGIVSMDVGVQTITVQDGNAILTGGNVDGAAALIYQNANADQILSIENGSLTLHGGSAIDAGALVIANADQQVSVSDYVSLTGGSVDASAVAVIGSQGNQTIQIDGDVLTGVDTDTALLIQGGDAGAAGLMSDARQTVTVTTGNVVLSGGTGADADAVIVSNGSDGAGPDEEAQRILVQDGNLLVTANVADAAILYTGADSQVVIVGQNGGEGYALITGGEAGTQAGISSTGTQTVTLAGDDVADFTALGLENAAAGYANTGVLGLGIKGGAGDNSTAGLSSLGNQNVTLTTGDLQIVGGTGNDSAAGIQLLNTAAASQVVTVTDGNALILGGSAGDRAEAGVRTATGQASTQTFIVTAGTLALVGGDGDDANVAIEHGGNGAQLVTASGTITVKGGAGLESNAAIEALGSGTQTVSTSGGNLEVIGGTGEDSSATIRKAGTGDQIITVSTGNLLVQADQDTVLNDAGGSADITVVATAGTQTITVGGNVTVEAGNDADEFAAIRQQSANAQILAVTGNIEVSGGAANNAYALISSAGTQTIAGDATDDTVATGGSLTVTGGTAGTGAYAAITSTDAQVINIGDEIEVLAGRAADALDPVPVDAHASITSQATQNITGGASLTLDALDGNNVIVTAVGTQTIEIANNIDIDANAATVLVESTGADQSITAATGDITIDATDASTVNVLAATNQVVDATTGSILVTADDSDVTIRNTAGTQDILAGTNIEVDATSLATVTVENLSGAQTVTATELIRLDANDSVITVNAANGTQDIEATNDSIELTANAAGTINVTASDTQTILAQTNIDVNANASTILVSTGADQTITAQTGDITIDATAASLVNVLAATTQDISVGNDLIVTATTGATVLVDAGDTQTIDVANDLSVVATDGGTTVTVSTAADQDIDVGNNLTIDATSADVFVTAVTAQDINVAALIDIDATNGAGVTIESTTANQIITAGTDIEIDIVNGSTLDIIAATTQDITATAGSITATADASATINVAATDAQTILAATFIDVNADNTAAITFTTGADQTITATTGDITIDATTGSTVNVLAGTTQDIIVGNDLIVTATTGATVLVDAGDTQTIDVANDLSVVATDGGTTVTVSTAADQDIDVGNNLMIDVTSADVFVTAATAQDINVAALIDIDATNGAEVEIESTGANQIIVAGTGIDIDIVNGSTLDIIAATTQDITATTGDLAITTANSSAVTVEAGAAQTITVADAAGDLTIDATTGSTVNVLAATTQDIIVGNDLIVTATTGATVLVDAGDTQTIDVANDLSVVATDGGTTVTVSTAADQDIDVGNDLTIETDAAGVTVTATGAQDINAVGAIDIDATAATGAVTIESTGSTQTITAQTGSITIDALAGSTVEVTADDTQTITVGNDLLVTAAGASLVTVDAGSTQTIDVDNDLTVTASVAGTTVTVSTAADQDIDVGNDLTLDASIEAEIVVVALNQSIDVGNALLLTADQQALTEVVASGLQQDVTAASLEISANNAGEAFIYNSNVAGTQNVTIDDTVLISAGANAFAGLGAEGTQNVEAASLTIEATAIDAGAEIYAGGGGTQTITIDSAINLTASGTDAEAYIASFGGGQSIEAASLAIEANATGAIAGITSVDDQEIVADSVTLTASAIDSDAYVIADADQTITVADSLVLAATAQDAAAGIIGLGALQEIGADSVTLTASGVDAGAVIFAGSVQNVSVDEDIAISATAQGAAAGIVGDGDQLVEADSIELLANATDAVALIGADGAQTIVSTGATNLTGSNDGRAVLVGRTIDLTTVGGVLTGNAQIGVNAADDLVMIDGFTATETIDLTTTGNITVADVDAAHVHLVAEAGTETITFAGSGNIGTVADRLTTSANVLAFAGTDGDIALDERVGSVGIEGTVNGGLNLLLTDALGGDITDSADFTATAADSVVSLETTDGSIILGGVNDVEVREFRGVVANNGAINLDLAGDTSLANRADGSSDAGVYADNGITITTAGDITVTADEVRAVSVGIEMTANRIEIQADLVEAEAGDIVFTAPTIVLAGGSVERDGTELGVTVEVPTGNEGVIRTINGNQTYAGAVELERDTWISATDLGAGDTVNFTGTIDGPGGLIIGSSPIFNAPIGGNTPLAYLLLLGTSNATFATTAASNGGLPTIGGGNPATVTLNGSFINLGTITLAAGGDYTFIVDAVSDALNGSVFTGGTVLGLDATTTITVFASAFNSVTFDNIPLGPQVYSSYLYNPFDLTNPLGGLAYQPGTVYFKGPNPLSFENLRERLERDEDEKDTTLAYDGTVVPEGIAELAGSLPEGEGFAGGVAVSTYDIVPAGQVETVTQIVFGNVVVIP